MIPFIDLAAQRERIDADVRARINAVLDHGRFIMGPEVFELEERLADRCRVAHAVSCASGTDALADAADGAGRRARATPSSCPPSPSRPRPRSSCSPAPRRCSVTCGPTRSTSIPISSPPRSRRRSAAGLRPVGVIAVDLFGQPAEYDASRRPPSSRPVGARRCRAEHGRSHRLTRRSVPWATSRRRASSRPSRWARTATGARCSPTTPTWPPRCGRSASTGKAPRSTTSVASASTGASTPSRPRSCWPSSTSSTTRSRPGRRSRHATPRGSADVAGVPQVLPGFVSAWAQFTITVDERDRVAETPHDQWVCRGRSTTRCRCTGRPPTPAFPLRPGCAAGGRPTQRHRPQPADAPLSHRRRCKTK